MNAHLTSEQLDSAIAGAATAHTTAHLQSCPACRAELHTMTTLLSGLRDNAIAAAEHRYTPLAAPSFERLPRLAWGFAAAVLFVGVSAPFAMESRNNPVNIPVTTTPTASTRMSDDALLSSIQNDLSSSVPASMLPLTGAPASASSTSSR